MLGEGRAANKPEQEKHKLLQAAFSNLRCFALFWYTYTDIVCVSVCVCVFSMNSPCLHCDLYLISKLKHF